MRIVKVSDGDLDAFGGCKCLSFGGRGFFYVTTHGGRFYLVDPDGYAFIVRGVNYVRFNGDVSIGGDVPYTANLLRRYGSRDAWVRETVRRLREWGFNTVAWSDIDLGVPYAINLQLTPGYYWLKSGLLARRRLVLARDPDVLWQPFGTFPDVYDPDYEGLIREWASRLVRPKDSMLVGYFTDNELDFNPDVVFREYADMTPNEPGKQALIKFIRGFFKDDVNELNRSLGLRVKSFDDLIDYTWREFNVIESRGVNLRILKEAFTREVARRYVEITTSVIKSLDPNHLILGSRFAGDNAKASIESFSGFDVLSNNYYGENPPIGYFNYVHYKTSRPIILSEFGFRARDTGHPNARGAGITVDSQLERALYVRSWVTCLIQQPWFLGYLWWEYMDEPMDGRRPDGEDSNYGLVNLNDEPYADVVEAFKEVNRLFPIPD